MLALCTSYEQLTHTTTRRNIRTPLIFVNVRLKDFSVGYAVYWKKNTLYGNPTPPSQKKMETTIVLINLSIFYKISSNTFFHIVDRASWYNLCK